jgi:hypothetical protein
MTKSLSRRGASPFFAFALLLVAVATACTTAPRDTRLQAVDFDPVPKSRAKFDRNNILDVATFTDTEARDATQIQRFFERTPYDRGSFLDTYQSNGTRASDAVLRIARTYRLNPIVLMVFLQIEGGLVGERNYPLPPERVEYAFRCGCLAAGNCLPALAGIDRQLDCLARELRTSLEQIAATGATGGRWGTDKTSTSLDGLKVTPANAATAALYQRLPRVRVDEDDGVWIFWNVWNRYITFMEYGGPVGNGSATIKGVGDPCASDGECGDGYTCSSGATYPGGYCTKSCTGDCPNAPDRPEGFCASFAQSGFCFVVCNPNASACRQGYVCKAVKRFGSNSDADAKTVCIPGN